MTVSGKAPPQRATGTGEVGARLMLAVLCFIWGFTWPIMKIALDEIPPLSMRTLTAAIGALTLLVICMLQRRSFRLANARAFGHVVAASFLNIVGFSLLSAFAQIEAATSRVVVLAYTLPVWTLLLAWLVLGERPSRLQWAAVGLCVCGLAILIGPLATTGVPLGLALAVGSGLSWAGGTVYLKWARIEADPLAVTSWQLTIAFFVIAAALFVFDGRLDLSAAHAGGLLAVAFAGIIGNGLAYALWFEIVRRVPAATATLGILGIPVISVAATVLILGERPTATDVVGFAFILAASACVLLAPPAVERARAS